MRTTTVDFGEMDRTLMLTPINISPPIILDRLGRGRTVFVRLEPGDMTRYDFFLIPLINGNVPTGCRDGWIGVVPVNNGRGIVCIDPLREANEFDFEGVIPNRYTRVVYATFFNLLREELL